MSEHSSPNLQVATIDTANRHLAHEVFARHGACQDLPGERKLDSGRYGE
jgi:hypothetical protein